MKTGNSLNKSLWFHWTVILLKCISLLSFSDFCGIQKIFAIWQTAKISRLAFWRYKWMWVWICSWIHSVSRCSCNVYFGLTQVEPPSKNLPWFLYFLFGLCLLCLHTFHTLCIISIGSFFQVNLNFCLISLDYKFTEHCWCLFPIPKRQYLPGGNHFSFLQHRVEVGWAISLLAYGSSFMWDIAPNLQVLIT